VQPCPVMANVLTHFAITRPKLVIPQERTLDWLAAAHAQSEAVLKGLDDDGRRAFEERLRAVIARVGCGPDRIAQRGASTADVTSTDWDAHELYDLRRDPHGRDTGERMRVFAGVADDYFDRAFPDGTPPPDDIVHVTCTGYLSPSAAQKLVSKRRWPTRIVHAYHMGCYAAVPAVRIALGLGRQVDIVHTELCSLHVDPTDHGLGTLVVQSLFADGLVRYSLVPDGPGLRVVAVHEQVLPDTEAEMTWVPSGHGMRMELARDVPDQISGAVRLFVAALFDRAGMSLRALRDTVFAVHPGGPKIIDRVRDTLELGESQVATSRRILLEHGNMSSATLPHIWAALLADTTIAPGTRIASLAFGPGLTTCGIVLEKQ